MATEEEMERGLAALAIYNGDPDKAAEALTAEGWETEPQQLRRWKSKRNKRYYELRNARIGVVRDRMAEAAGALADRRVGMLRKVMDRLEEKIELMEEKDLISLMRALDSGHASNIAAVEKLTDQASSIVEVRDPDQIMARLERMGVIESEPEVVDAEVVEDPQLVKGG